MATTDLITLAEAREAVNLASGAEDTILAAYVSAASLTLDALCGPVVQRTVTETVPVDVTDVIVLEQSPAASITSVVEYDSAGASTTLTVETVSSKPTSGYRLVRSRWLERRSSGAAYPFPYGGNVSVTYVAGRAASTSAVDAKFKTACKMLLANMWRFERGTGTQTFGGDGSGLPGFLVPNAVSALLADELLPPGIA
mgnify:CR=1 FL=1